MFDSFQKNESVSLYRYAGYVIWLCRHYIKIKVPEKLFYAVDQALQLIRFLDLKQDLYSLGRSPKKFSRNSAFRQQAIQVYRDARDILREMLAEENSVSDPIMHLERDRITAYMNFLDIILLRAMPAFAQNDQNIFWANRAFKDVYHIISGGSFELFFDRLNDSYHQAAEELREIGGIRKEQFEYLVKKISFCDRRELQSRNIFRISQVNRHLFFGKYRRPALSKLLTPKLDHYLLCRDLMQKTLGVFGSYIPIHFCKAIIHHYNEPDYWENIHMSLEKEDHLRLGIAYYQSAMDMNQDNSMTRILYHHTLTCFNNAGVDFNDDGLCEIIWEN